MHGSFFIFLRRAADWEQGGISGGWLGDRRVGRAGAAQKIFCHRTLEHGVFRTILV